MLDGLPVVQCFQNANEYSFLTITERKYGILLISSAPLALYYIRQEAIAHYSKVTRLPSIALTASSIGGVDWRYFSVNGIVRVSKSGQ